MNGVNGALRQFKEMSDALAPTWVGITEHLKQAPHLGEATGKVTASLNNLHTVVGQLFKDIGGVNAAVMPLSSVLTRALETLQGRIEALPPLADAVGRFVALAKEVAPTMEVLGSTFRDIKNINENIRLAAANLQTFNEQLNGANKATGSIATNSDKLIKSTDTLVEQVCEQVHKLSGLGEPIEHVGEVAKELVPTVDLLKSNLQTVKDFTATITALVQALETGREKLTATTTKLEEVPDLVKNFMDVTRELLVESRQQPKR